MLNSFQHPLISGDESGDSGSKPGMTVKNSQARNDGEEYSEPGMTVSNKSALNKGGGPCAAWWWVLKDDVL